MRLDNRAGVPALLFRGVIGEERFAAAVIARITYRIEAGRLVQDDEQPWPVSAAPWDGPEGKMPSDEVFYRGGVDLMVFGEAWAARGRPSIAVPVRVRCGGGFDHQIAVIGDRVWRRSGSEFVPTRPVPFVSMPLTLARAFGGRCTWDGLEVPFPDNPEGKGYCIDRDQVEGKPLPNIEDRRRPVQSWEDRPDPVGVGLCPAVFGPRLRETVRFDERGMITELEPGFFSSAFPRMVAQAVAPGDAVVVEGVSPDGPLSFTVPAPPLVMNLRVGDARLDQLLAVDQIGIQVAQRRVFITYRSPFRYVMKPRQERSCVLAPS